MAMESRFHVVIVLMILGCGGRDDFSTPRSQMPDKNNQQGGIYTLVSDNLIPAQVTGVVRSSSDNQPLDGVQIFHLGSSSRFSLQTEADCVTDASGIFRYETLVGGYGSARGNRIGEASFGAVEFYVGARKNGYEPSIILWRPNILFNNDCIFEEGLVLMTDEIILSATSD